MNINPIIKNRLLAILSSYAKKERGYAAVRPEGENKGNFKYFVKICAIYLPSAIACAII